MKIKHTKKLLCCLFLLFSTVSSCAVTVAAEDETTIKETQAMIDTTAPLTQAECHEDFDGGLAVLARESLEGLTLAPGGMPFGVKFYTEGVTVVGFSDVKTKNGTLNPASAAGLKVRDVILKIDGTALSGASDMTDRIEKSNGRELTLLCRRGTHEFECKLTPAHAVDENRYKTGLLIRESGAGIGTVTFVFPETGAFAGLGHGICDSETGQLIPMRKGTVTDVTISSVIKGAPGAPGELRGYFNAGRTGTLLGNSDCGVWGIYTKTPDDLPDALPVGLREDVHEGDAYILSTLDANKREQYAIRISAIKRDAEGPKCFTVTVTDPRLLEATGGIVQGMSGSPIIQDGKLIGAVTHVLVNDSAVGYGIFLENMLVNMPMPISVG